MKKRDKLSIMQQYYPDAISTIDGVNKIIDFIENDLDLEPQQIMFADSICSDDVNSIQYPIRTNEFLGPFKMGGLNGFPFTGLTGMNAFVSHVPDDGAVLIYYGPHVGITKTGIFGEINRVGQIENSSCCGAAKLALQHLVQHEIIAGHITEIDYQMNVIEQILYQQQQRILSSDNLLFTATAVMYEAIDTRINELIALTKYKCKYLIVMGGILINSDSDVGSYTAIKRCDVIDLINCERNSFLDRFLHG